MWEEAETCVTNSFAVVKDMNRMLDLGNNEVNRKHNLLFLLSCDAHVFQWKIIGKYLKAVIKF